MGGWHPLWTFACWRNRGLCAAPEINLVAFDGVDELDPVQLTSPSTAESMFTNLPTRAAEFPLTGPATAVNDADYDTFLEDVAYSGNSVRLLSRIREARHRSRR